MRVFVTGATGFIGSAVVRELLDAGHQVTGLARSEASAQKLIAAGAQVHRGFIEDTDSLRRGAAAADGVIHTAFYHEIGHISLRTRLRVFLGGSPLGMVGRFISAAIATDRRAIETLGKALAGADRPLVAAFGTMAMKPGQLAREQDAYDPHCIGAPRGASEEVMQALAMAGVRASVIRLPPAVHDGQKQGLGTMMTAIGRKKGLSVYVGDGLNRWPAVHQLDAAHLFRLALEKGVAGARYHAIAEEGIPVKEIAEAIGRRLQVPTVSKSPAEAAKHFGWLAPFLSTDNPASSQWTQEQLGWRPTRGGLIADIDQGASSAQ
jgi:nucleoside-diphosphate-sugar epimerase